jgi:hypothetical protein
MLISLLVVSCREAVKDEAAALMELGAKGVRERRRQEAGRQEAARQLEEAPPLNVREALIDQLVAEVGLIRMREMWRVEVWGAGCMALWWHVSCGRALLGFTSGCCNCIC